eukprot:g526.t1
MLTGVNLPAAQLQVAMGIPLDRIPDIRRLFGREPFGDDHIDFELELRNRKSKAVEIQNASQKLVPKETKNALPVFWEKEIADLGLKDGHVIATRITAENPDKGFTPTSGAIREINFRSTENVWGYFSVDSSGSVHEFADSQIGHLFSWGATREIARRRIVLALKEMSIRGDIRTTTEYLVKLLEHYDFVTNAITTSWLDERIRLKDIHMGKVGAGDITPPGATFYKKEKTSNDKGVPAHVNRTAITLEKAKPSMIVESSETKKAKPVDLLDPLIVVLIGAMTEASLLLKKRERTYLGYLARGHLPSKDLLSVSCTITLVLNDVKYNLKVNKTGSMSYIVENLHQQEQSTFAGTANSNAESNALVRRRSRRHRDHLTNLITTQGSVRPLPDGGFLVLVGRGLNMSNQDEKEEARSDSQYLSLQGTTAGTSHVTYRTYSPGEGVRYEIGGQTYIFEEEYDPTVLRCPMAGKLTRYLVANGDNVVKGQAFCEVEVMKMQMPLKVEEDGVISLCIPAGSVLKVNDVLANLTLKDASKVKKADLYQGSLSACLSKNLTLNSKQISQLSSLKSKLLKPNHVKRRSLQILNNVLMGYCVPIPMIRSSLLNLITALEDPRLPFCEFEEELARLTSRLPAPMNSELKRTLYKARKRKLPFPLQSLSKTLQFYIKTLAKLAVKKSNGDSSKKKRGKQLVNAPSILTSAERQQKRVEEEAKLRLLFAPLLNVLRTHSGDRDGSDDVAIWASMDDGISKDGSILGSTQQRSRSHVVDILGDLLSDYLCVEQEFCKGWPFEDVIKYQANGLRTSENEGSANDDGDNDEKKNSAKYGVGENLRPVLHLARSHTQLARKHTVIIAVLKTLKKMALRSFWEHRKTQQQEKEEKDEKTKAKAKSKGGLPSLSDSASSESNAHDIFSTKLVSLLAQLASLGAKDWDNARAYSDITLAARQLLMRYESSSQERWEIFETKLAKATISNLQLLHGSHVLRKSDASTTKPTYRRSQELMHELVNASQSVFDIIVAFFESYNTTEIIARVIALETEKLMLQSNKKIAALEDSKEKPLTKLLIEEVEHVKVKTGLAVQNLLRNTDLSVLQSAEQVQGLSASVSGDNSMQQRIAENHCALLKLSQTALEVYIRRMYRAYHIQDIETDVLPDISSAGQAKNGLSGENPKFAQPMNFLISTFSFTALEVNALPVGITS